jgi:zinc protease
MKVILAPRPGCPTVAARIIVKAGSASEEAGDGNGLAHLVGHMAFGGTPGGGGGGTAGRAERAGGELEWHVTSDETACLIELPAGGLRTAVELLPEKVFRPSFDRQEFARVKKVMAEQIRESVDSPEEQLREIFLDAAYDEGHPYAREGLATPESVDAISPAAALAFHRKFYRPDNCLLIVTGAFEPREALLLTGRCLAGIANPAEALSRPVIPAPPRFGPRIVFSWSPAVRLPRLLMGFRCPPLRSPEAPVAEMLAKVLAGSESARLNGHLCRWFDTALSVAARHESTLEHGFIAIRMECDPKQMRLAVQTTAKVLNRIVSDPPSEEEAALAAALGEMELMEKRAAPGPEGGLMGAFELHCGDFRLRDAWPALSSRVGGRDMADLAARIFVLDHLVAAAVFPAGAAPDLDAQGLAAAASRIPQNAESPAAVKRRTAAGNGPPSGKRAAGGRGSASGRGTARGRGGTGSGSASGGRDAQDAAGSFRRTRLKCGALLLAANVPASPTVDVLAAFSGGRLADRTGKEGASSLASALCADAFAYQGTGGTAPSAGVPGARVTGFSALIASGLRGTFPGHRRKEGMALFTEILRAPDLSSDGFRAVKAARVAYLKALEERLTVRTFALASRGLFPGHPYAASPLGTADSVESLTFEDVVSAWDAQARPRGLVLAVAGGIDPGYAAETLDEAFAAWKPGPGRGKADGTAPPAPPIPPSLDGQAMKYEKADSVQAHIALSFHAPQAGDPGQATFEVLNSALGGTGGMLQAEIRNARSLAHTVSSRYSPLLNAGSITMHAACSPGKAGDVVEAMTEVAIRSCAKTLARDLVEGAKRNIAFRNAVRRQTPGTLVRDAVFLELYGLEQNRTASLLAAVGAVTPTDVLWAAREWIVPERALLSVVGTESAISAAQKSFRMFR